MKEKIRVLAVFLYGLVILSLGYIGYKEAGSKASLWCGVGFGILLMLSAQIMRLRQTAGLSMAIGFSTLLTGVFSYRYIKTGKELPAVLAVISAGVLLYLLLSILGKKKSSRP